MKKFVPKWFQEDGIALFLKKSFAGLFWPPGLGKTAVALFAFDILRKKKIVKRMYVISTVKVITNTWPREIEKWCPHLSYCIVKGGVKRIEALEANTDIVLMNMENVQWFVDLVRGKRVKKKGRWKKLPAVRPEFLPTKAMLMIDESSKFRNQSSKRFKSLKRILKDFKRRYILTGSPAPKSLLNLWAQLFIIDLGESLGQYYTHFKTKYFHPAGFKGYEWVINDKESSEEIYSRISKRVLRVGESALKMPPLLFVDRKVVIDDEQRDLYKEMEREYIIELEGEEITAATAAVKTQKLRQLANGFIYKKLEKGKRKSFYVHQEKAFEVQELIEETQGTPALVGYQYASDLQCLLDVLGENTPVLKGGMKDKDSNKIISKWNEGKLDVLLCQVDTAAHGLNLQETHASVIYYTVPWDLEVYEQFYRRVWRQGQKSSVVVYRILLADSIDDEVVVKSIEKKDKRQRNLLNYLEKYMARRKKFVRPEGLTKIGNKEGMEIIAETMKDLNQSIPKVKEDVKDPGGTLLSAILIRVKKWQDETRLEFCKAVTSNENYDGSVAYSTVKKMVEEIFCLDVEKPIAPETYKMWKGYRPKGRKKMATKKAEFGSSKKKASKKKASTKKASKKKASKKKVSTKKAGTKKTASKKKTAKKEAPKLEDKTTYVAGDNDATPKIEYRQKITDYVKKAKGKGVSGTKILHLATTNWKMRPTTAIKHLEGCVKMKFIKAK